MAKGNAVAGVAAAAAAAVAVKPRRGHPARAGQNLQTPKVHPAKRPDPTALQPKPARPMGRNRPSARADRRGRTTRRANAATAGRGQGHARIARTARTGPNAATGPTGPTGTAGRAAIRRTWR